MTTGSHQPVEKKGRSRKNNQIVNETTPLLPSRHGEANEFHEFRGASFSGAVLNLSTTIVGAGIMALPATMKILGLIPGILMIIFFAFLCEASAEMLIRFSRVEKMTSYGGVMGDAFGRTGRMLLQICVIVNNVGIMVVYMIILGDVLSGTTSSGIHHSGLLEGWFGHHWWNGRFFVLTITTLFVLVPLASLKRLDSLRYTSALSIALAVVFVVITGTVAVVKLLSRSVQMPRLFPNITELASVWNLFTAVPVLLFSFICHFNVHSIDREFDDSSLIQPIVRTSLVLCSTVYIATSFFAYLLFGDNTLDDVLTNFDSDLGIPYSYLINDVVRVSYALHLMLVFPMIFFPLRLNFDALLFPSSRPLTSNNRRFAFVTVLLLSLIFLAANFIPSIWDAFQFTGATSSACIGFIFPAAITLKDRHGIATNWDKGYSGSGSNPYYNFSNAYEINDYAPRLDGGRRMWENSAPSNSLDLPQMVVHGVGTADTSPEPSTNHNTEECNGGITGSLTRISIGAVIGTQKVWRSLQAFGDIAFAYSYSLNSH